MIRFFRFADGGSTSAVHLETRCDGSAHGGCQASCLLFWKDAWLKPVSVVLCGSALVHLDNSSASTRCSSSAVALSGIRRLGLHDYGKAPWTKNLCTFARPPACLMRPPISNGGMFVSTSKTTVQAMWVSGEFFAVRSISFTTAISNAGIGLGRPMRWFYDTFYPLWGGSSFSPQTRNDSRTTNLLLRLRLDLQPGELVRIKSHKEILKTLNTAKQESRALL